ncbi:hypothetical protein [Erwinia tracheiphila]|uniref:Uncharacterized protein n=2 Tax=Erwinia tracheiphila TaxID=65700 RepID=A0A345CVZ7_9GAMM|nr:hypothetical protein [Erwinia tracheiphila]AXF77614.1 hypothetical protein AV903_18710 [Erwinia tracheiphila]EOS94476.1 hypothetical protein ETR_13636 [Erwinia tracheiphila PSU-1]
MQSERCLSYDKYEIIFNYVCFSEADFASVFLLAILTMAIAKASHSESGTADMAPKYSRQFPCMVRKLSFIPAEFGTDDKVIEVNPQEKASGMNIC